MFRASGFGLLLMSLIDALLGDGGGRSNGWSPRRELDERYSA